MTLRQRLLKWIYPLFLRYKRTKTNAVSNQNELSVNPPLSLYDLTINLINRKKLSLKDLEGKKILFVNTASDCGYTGQYAELEKLYEKFHDELEIIAFPANDFKEQEKGSNEEIESFCRLNYNIRFPLAAKSKVVRGAGQNEIFQWLTNASRNGWNDQQPTWNFSKYLVNENGILTHYFDPAVSPLDKAVLDAIRIPTDIKSDR